MVRRCYVILALTVLVNNDLVVIKIIEKTTFFINLRWAFLDLDLSEVLWSNTKQNFKN